MEQDRYQQNHLLFIAGMIGLVSFIGLIGFSLYIAPPLIMGWNYQIPQFIWDWQAFLQRDYAWTEEGAAWLIFSIFMGLGLLAAIIAWIASSRIDDAIYHVKKEEGSMESINRVDTEKAHTLEMKIFLLILLVIVGAVILQWFFYATA